VTRKKPNTRTICGIGVARTREENAKSGKPINPKSATSKGGGAAENKISIEIDGKKTKKVSFSKKLKILAKAYVAKIKKQAAEKDSDDKSE
jgi:hypothetical protein